MKTFFSFPFLCGCQAQRQTPCELHHAGRKANAQSEKKSLASLELIKQRHSGHRSAIHAVTASIQLFLSSDWSDQITKMNFHFNSDANFLFFLSFFVFELNSSHGPSISFSFFAKTLAR